MKHIKSFKALIVSEGLITEAVKSQVKIGNKNITFQLSEYQDTYVFIPLTSKDHDITIELEEEDDDSIYNGLLSFLNSKIKGVEFFHDGQYVGAGYGVNFISVV